MKRKCYVVMQDARALAVSFDKQSAQINAATQLSPTRVQRTHAVHFYEVCRTVLKENGCRIVIAQVEYDARLNS